MLKRTFSSFASSDPTLGGIVLCGILVRILSFIFSKNAGGDAVARLEVTAKWLQHPSLQLTFGDYPPGHSFLIAAFTLLFGDVAVAGRMLSLVLGIGSIFIVLKIAGLLYGDRASIFSVLVFSFYTLHIAYSTTSSSEVSYLFFLLVALFFFFSSLSQPQGTVRWAAMAGIALSIAASIRYEAWVFFLGMIAIAGVSVILRNPPDGKVLRERIQSLIAFGVTGSLWPALMSIYCWHRFGDPLYLVNANHVRVQAELATAPTPVIYQLSLTPAALALGLSAPVLIAAVFGLEQSFTPIAAVRKSRIVPAFAALTFFFAAVQTYEILRHGLVARSRYTLTLGALLAIISGFGLERFFEKISRIGPTMLRISVAGLLVANAAVILALSEIPNKYSEKFASVSPVLRYPRRVEKVANYLRGRLSAENAVVVDDYDEESNILAYAAGLPLVPGDRAYLANTKHERSVRDYVTEQHPGFMVYSDQGILRRSFADLPGCNQDAIVDGIGFHCVFADQIYRVYQLSYPGPR